MFHSGDVGYSKTILILAVIGITIAVIQTAIMIWG